MWEEGYLSIGTQQLHYLKAGSGSRLLLAFHGYGNDARLFGALGRLVGHAYTIVSVDLPYHGSSYWPKDQVFLKEELLLLAKGAMRLTGSDRLSLAGYSLGGRICLTLLELMPESVERVMLLAPDGLGGRRFYHFVTRTIIGKRLFRHYLEDGRRIARLAGLLHRCGLLGAARHRFLSKYTGSESARKLLLQVWPSMRYLVPDLRKVRNLIRKHHIPVYLFTGRHDPIIRPHFARLLSRNLPEVQVTVLDHGHYLLHEHILQKITPCLL